MGPPQITHHRHRRSLVRPSTLRTSRPADLVRNDRGAALLEFAVTLPLLVVFIVGIYDFSAAFNQKQKIAQAAQEGAIIAGAQPMSDIQTGATNPASLQPVVSAIFNSLVGSGILTSGTCGPPLATAGAGLTWIYTISGCTTTSSDVLTVTINRGWTPATGTPASIGTTVTVQYPYHWQFNRVIQSLIPGANYAAITQLTESASVHNQM
jgi:Flp pilus assembly protein TadG